MGYIGNQPGYVKEAADLPYDAEGNGLAATNINAAVNEVVAKIGANDGIAQLDSNGLVEVAHLPEDVKNVAGSADKASLPGTGVEGRVYVVADDEDNNHKTTSYVWDAGASAYVVLSNGSTVENADDLAGDSATDSPSVHAVKTFVGNEIQSKVLDEIVDDVTTGGSNKFLSAEQGKLLASGKMDASVLIDEDDMSSDDATKVPSQQSVKAFVEGQVGSSLLDEDDMASNSAAKAPSQQSVVAYVGSEMVPDMTVDGAGTVHANNYTDTTYTVGDGGLTEKNYVAADKDKVGYLTVTAATDLDSMRTRVAELDAAVVLKGTYDASGSDFPTSTKAGESWIVDTAGTTDSVAFEVGDRLVAVVDSASTSTYANNWLKLDYTDKISSVAGRTGAVVLAGADVAITASGNLAATDTQGAVDELQGDIDTLNADNATTGSVDEKIKTQVLDNLVDEDDMASDDATKFPTQQSVKAYANTTAEEWATKLAIALG